MLRSSALVASLLLFSNYASQLQAQTAKNAGASKPAKGVDAVVPGIPSSVPQKVRAGIHSSFQEQIHHREQERVAAIKAATANLQSAKTSSDSIRPAWLVEAGRLQVDGLKLADAEKTFQRVMAEHPGSLWAIEARLFLFDLSLEHHLDADMAESVLWPARQWCDETAYQTPPRLTVFALSTSNENGGRLPLQSLGPVLGGAARPVEPNDRGKTNMKSEPAVRDVCRIAADVHLRAGLVAWIKGDAEGAQYEFQKALDCGANGDPISVLARKLQLKQFQPPLPDPVKNGHAEAAKLIRYAVLLEESPQVYRAHRLWDAVLKRPAEELTVPQKSFVLFHRAQCRFAFQNLLEKDANAIIKDYETSVKLYPTSEWADDATFLAGNVEFNLNRNGDRAVALWRKVLQQYPGSNHEDRCAYFVGVAYETMQKWDEAKAAFDDAKARFPSSSFNPLIDKHLRNVANELSRPPSKTKKSS